MIRWLGLALFGALLLAPGESQAQERLVVLIVDPGNTRMNQERLRAAIERTTHRSLVRMTDDRAPSAHGRLTIAFSRPNRWVLRYEAGGQVAWVSDRISSPGRLRNRLAELSRGVVNIVDGETPAPGDDRSSRGVSSARVGGAPPRHRDDAWNDDLILALQDEIVDPFQDDPPRRVRPVTVLWSEVIDPFTGHRGTRASIGEVWSEVLDPWASEHHRRR